MRRSIIPGLLDTLKFNQARQNLEGRLFETGRTFRDVEGTLYEMVSVGFVMAAPESARLWKTREAADFSQAKRLVQSLAELAGLNARDQLFRLEEAGGATWQAGHSAVAGSFKEGFEARVGLINLAVTRDLAIDGPVIAGTIEILPDVLRRSRRQTRYKPFSNHPAATRDLALICDQGAAAADVQGDLTKAARKALNNAFALEEISLFDVYEGTGLPDGKKSLAFALTFRASDRTLTDAEVNGVFSSVQKLIEEGGYTVRR
jgi:phenylalanyl-tRNA synthetase beta chain